MTEKLLQFIWQHRLYNTELPLQTTEHETIIVLHPGSLNTHAGPDFLEAKLKIGETVWAGNIEIHLKSSDWNKHLHQHDASYSNLILHVVFEDDEPIRTKDNLYFPTLVLHQHINQALLENYERLMQNHGFIPCAKLIDTVRDITIHQQLDRMLIERLTDKTEYIQALLERFQSNWQEVFYVQLARGFGLHINQDVFERLALQTPLNLFAKHKQQLLQIEALVFGQAGFLNDYFDEAYPQELQREYAYLKKLYSLHSIEQHQWKFLRLRPANFPTLRLAQFAQLLHESSHLFSKIMEADSLKSIEKLFRFTVSEYWLNHYTFQEKSAERTKKLGKTFIQNLIINVIIPTVFLYGKLQAKPSYCNKALEWLRALPPEKNSIIDQWKTTKIDIQSAYDTQALLQLKKHYCDHKQCLSCGIGYALLKTKP